MFQKIRRPWRLLGQYGAGTRPTVASSGMAFEIASDSHAFFVVANLLLPTNIAKYYSNS